MWIKVSERFPKPWETILMFRPEKGAGQDQIWYGYFSVRKGFYDNVYNKPLDNVTHWQSLPPPPEEE